MNQMAEEGKKELVTAINSCLCLWTGDSWRQVCTNCGVVTGTPNTLLCCWITHAEPSNLPSLTKIKFIAAITKLEKMENSSGEVQQQFGNNDKKRLKLAAWGGRAGRKEHKRLALWFTSCSQNWNSEFSQNHINTHCDLDDCMIGLHERENKLSLSFCFCSVLVTFIAIYL